MERGYYCRDERLNAIIEAWNIGKERKAQMRLQARELKEGEIDLGVLAIRNTLGGTVMETAKALEGEEFTQVGREILQIHHQMMWITLRNL